MTIFGIIVYNNITTNNKSLRLDTSSTARTVLIAFMKTKGGNTQKEINMFNPYSKVMANDPSVPATSQNGLRGGVRVGGRTKMSDLPAFGANGELNASSNKELMQVIAQVVTQAQSSVITRPAETVEDANMRLAALVEAYNDKSGNQFQVLGEVISEEILVPRILV